MNERERLIVSGLVVLMLVTWLGFVLHRSPDFAGSAWGGVLAVSGSPQPWRWWLGAWLMPAASPELARVVRLTESIADLEYAIASNETFKRGFGLWLKFHIVISFVLYGLLGLHVWAAIHFGLRWFS